MTIALVTLLVLVLVFYGYRAYWMNKAQPRIYTSDVACKLYRVGETGIAVREGDPASDRTIICFPGLLEDMRYFLALYEEEDCQLILLNNAAYHVPVEGDEVELLDWDSNPHTCGTIEYDGFHLAHVLDKLASGKEVILHGHSRGGAVVLEAGRQFPQWTRPEGRYVRAVLEAAVLPGAKTAGPGSHPLVFPLVCLFIPIVLGLSRKHSREQLLKQPMMRPTNALKTELCESIYFLPERYRTCVVNIRSIWNWQRGTDAAVYDNYERIDVVIGERDDVLDNPSMIQSAETGAERNDGVSLLHTEQTNHFVSLEQPSYLRSLL
ncbi:MAG: alpha/beta hydrolase [Halioglobus sp.]